jgi:L-malate glycosyltransferase
MKRVLIIEAQIKQYRVPFYEGLRTELNRSGIELRVGYSDPNRAEASKNDNCDLPRDYGKKVTGHWLFRDKVLFQPLLSAALNANLVIVDQANKLLLNHFILPLSRCSAKRVAFWGHGKNGREDQWRLSEWYRRCTLNWVGWWFAYTRSTSMYLMEHGVPATKITIVDNAIDTNEIRQQVRHMSLEKRLALRASLSIPASAPVALYCGGLDEMKKIPFLINSAKLVHARIPDLHLLLVGGGPQRASVESAINGLPWIHSMGPRFGVEKSKLMAISDLLLVPGAVGLVILDAFAAGLPLLSTRLTIHGPEIEYLEEGINGLLSEPDVAAFANTTASLLENREFLERLQQGARASGSKYTIENMVANFKGGIECCLGKHNSSQLSVLKDGIV